MARPSQDWDRDTAAAKPAERCPVCLEDNADAEGEALWPSHFPYCSEECAEEAEAE
jgi:hypothetical protein